MPPLPLLPGEGHVCRDCDVDYSVVDVAAGLDVIRDVPAAVAAQVSSLTDATLRHRPDDTTWSALEYVCHLRDVYAVSTIRLHRTRVELRPSLEPMLNDLRVVRFRYNEREVGPVVAELGDTVAGFIDEAARCSGADWDRVATRLPGEERSARWLVRHAMHEGVHHVRDIAHVVRRTEA